MDEENYVSIYEVIFQSGTHPTVPYIRVSRVRARPEIRGCMWCRLLLLVVVRTLFNGYLVHSSAVLTSLRDSSYYSPILANALGLL